MNILETRWYKRGVGPYGMVVHVMENGELAPLHDLTQRWIPTPEFTLEIADGTPKLYSFLVTFEDTRTGEMCVLLCDTPEVAIKQVQQLGIGRHTFQKVRVIR